MAALSLDQLSPQPTDEKFGHVPPYVRQCGFVGRLVERHALEEMWSQCKNGEVTTALVTGEPGVGKTTLCNRVVKKTVLQGAGALTATGYELQRNLPYGVVTQLLKDAHGSGLFETLEPYWREILGDLLPLVRTSSKAETAGQTQEETSYRFAGAVHHLIDRAAHARPVTIFVDDVQWADSASMAIIHYLAHYDMDLPIFVLLASRDQGVHSLRTGGWYFGASMRLKGLALEESRVLVEELSLPDEAVDIDVLYRLSGGNPFLLQALLSSHQSMASGLPASVKQYFKHQLDCLSPTATMVGAALSAIGEPLSGSELSWLSETSTDQLNGALTELINTGFLETQQNGAAFALNHDILGEVFLDRLQPVASAKLHGRVARLLRDRGSPVAVVATQMTVAGDDPETCSFALQAAHASARLYANREAEHFFRIAVGTASSAPIELEARIALAKIFRMQGRSEDAEILLRRFSRAEDLSDRESALLEANLLMAQLSANNPPTFPHDAYRRAIELENLLPPIVATQLYADIGSNAQHGLHDLLGDAMGAAKRTLEGIASEPDKIRLEVGISACQTLHAFSRADLNRLDRLTRSSSRWPTTFAACLSASSLVRVSQGMVVDAAQGFLQALQICEQYGFWDQRLRALNNLGVCLLEQGRFSEAEEQFSAVVRSGGSVAPKEIPGALNNLLIVEYEKGEFEKTIDLGTKHLREPLLQSRLSVGLLGVMGLASLELGRLAHARECQNSIQTDTAYGDGLSNDVSYVEIFLARMAIIDGAADRAERRLQEQVETFASRDFYCAARMEVELLRLVASHAPDTALDRARELRPSLAAAHATPLVMRLDDVVSKCENRLSA